MNRTLAKQLEDAQETILEWADNEMGDAEMARDAASELEAVIRGHERQRLAKMLRERAAKFREWPGERQIWLDAADMVERGGS